MRFILFAILAIVTLAGCAGLKELPVKCCFDGINSAVHEQNATTSVFIVHGVGGYSEGDPETLIKAIESQLCLRKSAPECVREIINDSTGKTYGFLKMQEYRVYGSSNTVRIYSLDWRSTTWKEKSHLRYFDSSLFTGNKRLPLIKEMKEWVIDNSIADTVLYLSGYRNEIHFPFIQSVRWIQDDAKDDIQHNNIVIGFSLGGVICINGIDEMQKKSEDESEEDSDSEIAKAFIHDLREFFMLSNNFPIIGLCELPEATTYHYNDKKNCDGKALAKQESELNGVSCEYLEWDWECSALGRFVNQKRQDDPIFQIISISDPNDIISYNGYGYPVPSGNGYLNAFLSQDVRNVKETYFGYIDPREAHTGYGKNPKVLWMVIHGIHASCGGATRDPKPQPFHYKRHKKKNCQHADHVQDLELEPIESVSPGGS